MDASTHWRDSARTPRFFMLDYRAVAPWVIMLVAPEFMLFYAFIAVIIITIFFVVIEHLGFTMSVAIRWVRNTFISGKYKQARPWWRVG